MKYFSGRKESKKIKVERYQSSIDEEQNCAEPLILIVLVYYVQQKTLVAILNLKNLLDASDCLCGKKSHKDGKKTKKASEQAYVPPKS